MCVCVCVCVCVCECILIGGKLALSEMLTSYTNMVECKLSITQLMIIFFYDMTINIIIAVYTVIIK